MKYQKISALFILAALIIVVTLAGCVTTNTAMPAPVSNDSASYPAVTSSATAAPAISSPETVKQQNTTLRELYHINLLEWYEYTQIPRENEGNSVIYSMEKTEFLPDELYGGVMSMHVRYTISNVLKDQAGELTDVFPDLSGHGQVRDIYYDPGALNLNNSTNVPFISNAVLTPLGQEDLMIGSTTYPSCSLFMLTTEEKGDDFEPAGNGSEVPYQYRRASVLTYWASDQAPVPVQVSTYKHYWCSNHGYSYQEYTDQLTGWG